MSPIAIVIVDLFSNLTLIADILVAGLMIVFATGLLAVKNKFIKKTTNLVTENYIALIFLVSAVATLGSLSFSEIAGFIPCKLCWFQRIAMYPIALISFIALLKNDTKVKQYILPIAIIGFLIAFYHVLVQTFPTILECSDEVAKCSAREFAQYGYITIPVMSLSAFLIIILISVLKDKKVG